ncbi:MAG: DUF2442 domain-containing protein [Planctomycetes bacterium]|nr:DUF2442 domain-containing protein [Planctomycetota bacterium]
MFPRVAQVRHLKDYELEIRFSDGTVAKLDLGRRIRGRGGVFEPLQNVDFFAQVSVDREAGTLVWPNGVDFCPDVLYAEATGKDIAELGNELELA